MTIAYVNSFVNSTSYSGALSVTLSGTTAGNLLIGFCAKDDGANAISQPTGWTEIDDYDRSSAFRAYSCWKIAEGDESSVTFNGDNESYAAMVFEFSGVDTSAYDQHDLTPEFSNPLIAPASAMTPSADNAMIVHAIMHDQGSGATITYDTDLTYPNSVENSGSGTSHVGIQVGYEIQTTATEIQYSHTDSITSALITFIWLESTGGGSTPKGPLGHPFFGPFGGPIS